MLRDAAVAEIKRGLGFRQTQTTSIIDALKQAQRTLEKGRTLPDWMLEFDAPIAVTAGDPVFTLPTGFLRMHEEYDLSYLNSNNATVFLPRKNFKEAYLAYISDGSEDALVDPSTSNYPKVWARRGETKGYFFPTPQVSFTASMTYYKAGDVLDSNMENIWLREAPDLLIGLAGINIAGVVRDKDALTGFTQRYKMGLGSFIGAVVEDELAGRGLIMGRDN